MTGHQRVTFNSRGMPGLALEGIVHWPEAAGPWPAAVVAHPHPLYGGTMHNNLVIAIARGLAAHGIAALRFNFRGVMGSEGEHDNGRGEQDDVVGAIDWLLAQPDIDPARVAATGYSFGAWVALTEAVGDPRVRAVAAVGLAPWRLDGDVSEPVDSRVQFAAGYLQSLTRPRLFIAGDRDPIAPAAALRTLVSHLPPPVTLHVLPGADHSFALHERHVAGLIARFLRELFTQSPVIDA